MNISEKVIDIVKGMEGIGGIPTDEEFLNEFEFRLKALKQGQTLPIDSVVGSYSLKVGDNIKLPSGLKAKVIKTKVKVKDDFGGEYYLSDIEVG